MRGSLPPKPRRGNTGARQDLPLARRNLPPGSQDAGKGINELRSNQLLLLLNLREQEVARSLHHDCRIGAFKRSE
jgi:hypothetical protein